LAVYYYLMRVHICGLTPQGSATPDQ